MLNFSKETPNPLNEDPTQIKQQTQHKRPLIIIIAIAALLIAAASFQLYRMYHKSNTVNSDSDNKPEQAKDTRPPRQFAPVGQLAEGINKNLLTGSYTVTESYKRPFDRGIMQYVAEYDSDKTIKQLYDFYKGYFTANGYNITNQNFDSKISNLYGVKDNFQVNIVITVKDKNSHVIVNYLETK